MYIWLTKLHFLQSVLFPHWTALSSLLQVRWPHMHGSASELPVVFHSSVFFLSLHQFYCLNYHSFILELSFWQCNFSSLVVLLDWQPWIYLALLHFHIHLESACWFLPKTNKTLLGLLISFMHNKMQKY